MLRRPPLEHRTGKAQVTPDANARQTTGTCGITHPRRTNIEQRRGLVNIEQRLVKRQHQGGVNGHDWLPVQRYTAAPSRDQTKIASPCLLEINSTCVSRRTGSIAIRVVR